MSRMSDREFEQTEYLLEVMDESAEGLLYLRQQLNPFTSWYDIDSAYWAIRRAYWEVWDRLGAERLARARDGVPLEYPPMIV